ncbi:MAG: transglutaminase domain-containing protein [Eubacteriales bacterium]
MDYKQYRSQYRGDTVQKHREPQKKSPDSNSLIVAMIVLVLMLLLITALMIVTVFMRPEYVARSVTVEAGREGIYASDFIVAEGHTAEFAEGVTYDLSSVNEYKITLIVDGKKCISKLIVVDTQPPTARAGDISVWQGSEVSASDCVKDIVDATKVEVSFKKKPDTNKIGKHEVTVVLTDEGGNKTEYKIFINVVPKDSLLYTHYVSELGEPLPSADVFSGKSGVGRYLSDISGISTTTAGIYMLQIEAEGKTYDVVLEIADRTPPTATVTPQNCYNKAPSASDFISDIVDCSEVTVRYQSEPSIGGAGTYDVVLVLTDAHGNQTIYTSYFILAIDTEAPVISKAPEELEVDTGKPIIWRALVEASDNSGSFELFLDISGADLDLPGKYTVEIVARDAAGNETRRSVKLTVNDGFITDAMLAQVIKSLEADIGITPEMTVIEKIYQVYIYTKSSIHYVGTSPHTDWRHEAYATLSGGFSGDCFTYAAVSYAILDYLGFDVHLIERAESAKIEGTGTHFWLLVNIGTESSPAWYHFDSTPQAAPYHTVNTYLMTDAQIDAFTRWRNSNKLVNYYVYDKEKYPAVCTDTIEDLTDIPPEFYY